MSADQTRQIDELNNDLAVALAEVHRLRAGIRNVASWVNDPDAYPSLIALVDPSEDIYSQF